MSLTDDQVNAFLTKKLGIPDWKSKLEASKFDLFLEIDQQFKRSLIYENITWGSQSFDQLKPPTIKETCQLVLENGGGACLQLNYAIHLLFKYLGYDTLLLAAQTVAGTPRDHAMVAVRFPKQTGESTDDDASINLPEFQTHNYYLVDVGWIRPFPVPILLNKLPNVYKTGGFRVEHRYNMETAKFELLLHDGDPFRGAYVRLWRILIGPLVHLKQFLKTESHDEMNLIIQENVSFKKYSEFDLQPLTFQDFDASMTQIYTNPDNSFFLHTIAVSRFLALENQADHLFVCFKGRSMITLTESTIETIKFERYIDMLPAVMKYFPELNQATLQNALINYEERQLKYK